LRALRGERDEAQRLLAQLMESGGYLPSYEISKAWFALGASGKADAWLQRAFEERSHSLVFLRVDPQLSTHRQDAAFIRVAEQVGFGAGS
jgi:hypothetical protein